MAIQSLIQMMCREMLVLEEKELVCVEVKWKMEREREKRVVAKKERDRKTCGFAKTCVCMHICAHARARLSKMEKGERKRQSETPSRRKR